MRKQEGVARSETLVSGPDGSGGNSNSSSTTASFPRRHPNNQMCAKFVELYPCLSPAGERRGASTSGCAVLARPAHVRDDPSGGAVLRLRGALACRPALCKCACRYVRVSVPMCACPLVL
uniref:Uncharacterized protein n=1 Tax=Anopheles melas TaxID=34690 RepID=A0A182UAB8_9DIPT